MTKQAILSTIREIGLVPVVRTPSAESAVKAIELAGSAAPHASASFAASSTLFCAISARTNPSCAASLLALFASKARKRTSAGAKSPLFRAVSAGLGAVEFTEQDFRTGAAEVTGAFVPAAAA